MEQGDRLDHIARCPVVRERFVEYGVCPFNHFRAKVFLLCDYRYTCNHNIHMSGILIAALYKMLNKLRHGAALSSNVGAQFDKYVDDCVAGASRWCHQLVRDRRLRKQLQR